jgi:hypothetical protein
LGYKAFIKFLKSDCLYCCRSIGLFGVDPSPSGGSINRLPKVPDSCTKRYPGTLNRQFSTYMVLRKIQNPRQ